MGENVNHTWQGLGHVDLDAELRAKDTNMQTARKYIRDRDDCDYCFMGCVVSCPAVYTIEDILTKVLQYKTGKAQIKCEQAVGLDGRKINRCQPCVDRGLPCSWSFVDKLFGDPWTKMVALINKTRYVALREDLFKYPERFREVESALHLLTPNMAAQTTHRVTDPRPRHVGTSQDGDIEEEIREQAEMDHDRR